MGLTANLTAKMVWRKKSLLQTGAPTDGVYGSEQAKRFVF
jgi:hypothetical protein